MARTRLGERACKVVSASDPEVLVAFPHRAPDDLLALYARAERVSGIMAELDPAESDAGLGRFWKACGEGVAELVREKVGAGRPVARERATKPARPHPEEGMDSTL